MRRGSLLFFFMALGLLLPLVAHAGPGVNLRWDNCLGDGGAQNKSFACNTNTGLNDLVLSFVLAAPVTQVALVHNVVDIATAAPTLPAWWQFFNSGACRVNSLSANFALNPTAVACTDWAAGAGMGGVVSYTVGTFGPNTATIQGGDANATVQNLSAGLEYFAANFRIDHQKTVGLPAQRCDGCSIPACISVRETQIFKFQAQTPTVIVSGPTNGVDSNFVTWQGGAGARGLPLNECPAAVPTRGASWNMVKGLYR